MKKIKKNKIIILTRFKFKKFDLDRYEIKFFKKKFNVEIHDFSKLLYPHYNSSFTENYAIDEAIKKFKSVEKWKKHIHKIRKFNNSKVFVLN